MLATNSLYEEASRGVASRKRAGRLSKPTGVHTVVGTIPPTFVVNDEQRVLH